MRGEKRGKAASKDNLVLVKRRLIMKGWKTADRSAAHKPGTSMSDDDYYHALEVARDASDADIRNAYFRLARKYHPDKNPDDAAAKQKFQKIQRAYDVLSDQEKRKQYDRFGAAFDQQGQPPPGGFHRRGAGGGGGGVRFEDVDLSDLFGGGGAGGEEGGFSQFFDQLRRGGGGRRAQRRAHRKPAAKLHEITVPFQTAVLGGDYELAARRDDKIERITARIPAGISEGQKIRLKGQGDEGPGGRGDLLVTVHVAPHPQYSRRGADLEVRVPVSLAEAAEGAAIDVPGPRGVITVRIPAGASGGTRLRVKGQGVAAAGKPPGDLYVVLQLVMPKDLDDEDRAALARIAEKGPADPRGDLKW